MGLGSQPSEGARWEEDRGRASLEEKGRRKGYSSSRSTGLRPITHHFDLRLEKGRRAEELGCAQGACPLRKGAKRLAIKVRDHPMRWASFEGTIPPGEYGLER
jgi:hypothetical protein